MINTILKSFIILRNRSQSYSFRRWLQNWLLILGLFGGQYLLKKWMNDGVLIWNVTFEVHYLLEFWVIRCTLGLFLLSFKVQVSLHQLVFSWHILNASVACSIIWAVSAVYRVSLGRTTLIDEMITVLAFNNFTDDTRHRRLLCGWFDSLSELLWLNLLRFIEISIHWTILHVILRWWFLLILQSLLQLLIFFLSMIGPLLLFDVPALDILILAHSDCLSFPVIFAVPLNEKRLLRILLNWTAQLLVLVDVGNQISEWTILSCWYARALLKDLIWKLELVLLRLLEWVLRFPILHLRLEHLSRCHQLELVDSVNWWAETIIWLSIDPSLISQQRIHTKPKHGKTRNIHEWHWLLSIAGSVGMPLAMMPVMWRLLIISASWLVSFLSGLLVLFLLSFTCVVRFIILWLPSTCWNISCIIWKLLVMLLLSLVAFGFLSDLGNSLCRLGLGWLLNPGGVPSWLELRFVCCLTVLLAWCPECWFECLGQRCLWSLLGLGFGFITAVLRVIILDLILGLRAVLCFLCRCYCTSLLLCVFRQFLLLGLFQLFLGLPLHLESLLFLGFLLLELDFGLWAWSLSTVEGLGIIFDDLLL